MSIPLRFAVSEKVEMILPCAGHTQSSFSSSISGTRPSERGVAVAIGGPAAATGAEGAVDRASGAIGGGGTGEVCCSCASACGEYGSFTARGSVLKVAVLPRPLPGASVGRASVPLATTGGAVTRGVVTAPPAGAAVVG